MTQVKYTAEQIIGKLREGEVLLAQGMVTEQMCRKLGIHSQTYYRWRRKHGGMKVGTRLRRSAYLPRLACSGEPLVQAPFC